MKTSELKETIRELVRQTLTEKEKIQGRLPHPGTQGSFHRNARKLLDGISTMQDEVARVGQQVKDDGIPVDPKSKKWISQCQKLLLILKAGGEKFIKLNPDDGGRGVRGFSE